MIHANDRKLKIQCYGNATTPPRSCDHRLSYHCGPSQKGLLQHVAPMPCCGRKTGSLKGWCSGDAPEQVSQTVRDFGNPYPSPFCAPPATRGRAVPRSESLPELRHLFCPGLWAASPAAPRDFISSGSSCWICRGFIFSHHLPGPWKHLSLRVLTRL